MIDDFEFSRHATERILDMALDPADVILTLTQPDWIRVSGNYPDAENHVRGRIALPVCKRPNANGKRTIITALWATADAWEDDYKLPFAPGRERRINDHLPRETPTRRTA